MGSWLGNELVVHGGGQVLEAGELLAFQLGFLLGEDFRVEGPFVFQQMSEHTRQLVRHRRDG